MKQKVQFTMMVTREFEIELDNYSNVKEVITIEEAAKWECGVIEDDPFMFIDDEKAKIETYFKIL